MTLDGVVADGSTGENEGSPALAVDSRASVSFEGCGRGEGVQQEAAADGRQRKWTNRRFAGMVSCWREGRGQEGELATGATRG